MLTAKKRQRLDAVNALRTVGMSDSALARLLGKIKASPGILEDIGPGNHLFWEATLLQLKQIEVTIDLQLQGGGVFKWSVAPPLAMLHVFFAECPALLQLFEVALKRRPSTMEAPWRAVLYHDEVTPGNVIKPDNRRKLTIIYMNFIEPNQWLRSEFTWLPVACLRHTTVNQVRGGMSAVMRAFCSFLFEHECGFAEAGDVLRLLRPVMFWVKLEALLADEAALKSTWNAKGASGLKPCLLCLNVTCKGLHGSDNDFLQDISCPDINLCQFATDEEIWSMMDKLLQHQGSKAQLDLLEKACGLSANLLGLLASLSLRRHIRPAVCSTYDSMHCYYSHGVACVELHLLLQALATHLKIGFAHLAAFCASDWRFGKGKRMKSINHVFSPARESKDSLKMMASEVITVYPLVRHFVEVAIAQTGKIREQIESFRAMCECLDALQDIKMAQQVSESQCSRLQQAQQKHLTLFVACYGLQECKPKHHYALHIPGQVRRQGMLLDCFVLERKHISVKRHATAVETSIGFERSVLARVFAEQIAEMPLSFLNRLIGKTVESSDLASACGSVKAFLADSMSCSCAIFHKDDVLFNDNVAMVILACLQADAKFLLLVRPYSFARFHGAGRLWKAAAEVAVFAPESGFRQPSAHTFQKDELLLTLP